MNRSKEWSWFPANFVKETKALLPSWRYVAFGEMGALKSLRT